MKHLSILRKLLLMLCVMLCGANVWGENWKRCTSVEDLLAGGTFIIGYEATANSGIIVPMQNDGTATTAKEGYLYSGSTPGSTNSTTIDMSSVSETTSYEVTIASSTTVSGAITIKCPKGYVGNTNTKNNLKFFDSESSNTAFTPTVGNNDVFTLKITANTGNKTNYTTLEYNTSSPRFAVYGGTQKNVVIYKYVTAGSVVVPAPTFTVPSGSYTTSQTVKVDNYSGDYFYAYTTDGTKPTFDSDLEVTNGNLYDHETGVEINSSCTLKMVATDANGNTSSVASATYTLPIVFSSLDDLVAADLTSGTLVTVSFTDMPIKEIYITNAGNRSGVYFDIQKDGKDIEIYYQNVPGEWVKEGTLSGTMTCPWKKFNGTWELAPDKDTWDWTNLTYKAAAPKNDATLEFTSKTSLLVNESDAYTVTYNGDGTLSAESSDPSVATVTVSGSTVTVNALAKGEATITVSAPSTSNYYAVEKSYVLYVSAPLTPAENGYETVDFTQIEPYCSLPTNGSATMEKYEGASFNIVFAKPQSSSTPTKYYKKGDAVRAYTGNTMTITGAENILGVKVNYVSGNEDSGEEITGLGTKEVVITSSATCRFTSVDVYYKGVDLTATDGTDYYATFSSDKAVEFVDATVYTVDVNGSALVLNEVASKQVPAHTGVLIKTASTKALYKYIDVADALENNKLVAASVAMEGNKKFYKLAYGDWTNKTDLGFYWGAENGGAFDAKTGGAYLAVPTEAAIKSFVFGDVETAIKSVEAENASEAIYDLSGRRVSKAVKGLYIINGKKVVK